MEQMRSSGPLRPAAPVPAPPQKASQSEQLAASFAAAGLRPAELFAASKVAFGRVESVSAGQVAVELLGRTVTVSAALLPGARAEQWLRFSAEGAGVVAAVDLRATLRAESRLADLFVSLGGC